MSSTMRTWRLALSWLVAGGTIACGTSDADIPRLTLGAGGFALTLPPPMQEALTKLAPGFRAVSTASFRSDVAQAAAEGGSLGGLFAVVGDFDGDGSVDAAIEGSTPADSALVVIAILNKGSQSAAVQVARFPTYDADAVGVYLAKPATGSPGAFTVVNYPDASITYAFRGGKFVAQ